MEEGSEKKILFSVSHISTSVVLLQIFYKYNHFYFILSIIISDLPYTKF